MKPFDLLPPLFLLQAMLLACTFDEGGAQAESSSSTTTEAPSESTGASATTVAEQTSSGGAGSSSGSADEHGEGGSSDADAGESTTGEPLPGEVPKPTAPCPEFVDGWVTFCPAELTECRDTVVANAADADGSGPLEIQWHGTYESPDGYLDWDYSTGEIRTMIEQENGLLVLPAASPDALGPNDPYPWFIVCVGSDCSRPDDFILFDEIAACAVDQQLVDPKRIVTSGMSAGGIQVSHIVERVDWLAGAVSWSGGLSPFYRPAEPAGNYPVIVVHGGPTDSFGGYSFQTASISFAEDLAERGTFTILCNHGNGHNSSWITGVAPFMAQARHGEPHPFEDYPFGSGGDWGFDMYCDAVPPPP